MRARTRQRSLKEIISGHSDPWFDHSKPGLCTSCEETPWHKPQTRIGRSYFSYFSSSVFALKMCRRLLLRHCPSSETLRPAQMSTSSTGGWWRQCRTQAESVAENRSSSMRERNIGEIQRWRWLELFGRRRCGPGQWVFALMMKNLAPIPWRQAGAKWPSGLLTSICWTTQAIWRTVAQHGAWNNPKSSL